MYVQEGTMRAACVGLSLVAGVLIAAAQIIEAVEPLDCRWVRMRLLKIKGQLQCVIVLLVINLIVARPKLNAMTNE